MKYFAVIILIFWSCTSCNGNNPKSDKDGFAENDTEYDIDLIQPDKDSDDLSDEALAESDETDDEVELADVDYQGAELEVCIYFANNAPYVKGVYNVDVYTEEGKLGSADLLLR